MKLNWCQTNSSWLPCHFAMVRTDGHSFVHICPWDSGVYYLKWQPFRLCALAHSFPFVCVKNVQCFLLWRAITDQKWCNWEEVNLILVLLRPCLCKILKALEAFFIIICKPEAACDLVLRHILSPHLCLWAHLQQAACWRPIFKCCLGSFINSATFGTT